MPRLVYTLKDIVARTGLSYDWLARANNRKRLYGRGFPKPLNLPGHPKWSQRAVDDYLGGAPATHSSQQATDGRKSDDTAEIITIEAGKRKLMDALAS